jgi:predicted extracellular nuclease
MADTLRIATFNAENLFARYNFEKGEPPVHPDGFTIDKTAFKINSAAEKQLTAKAIADVGADVICLQEIESLGVLDRFVTDFLPKNGYDHRILVDSHDPRQIDVAILSKHPLTSIRSHRQEMSNRRKGKPLFSRDCLEVGVAPTTAPGKGLLLYVNHLKSMLVKGAKDGRAKTRDQRIEQAERVAQIVDERWQDVAYDGSFAVVGDMNDYIDPVTSLTALVQHKGLENVVARRPKADQWTHFYDKGKEYRQLDYILLSKALDERAGKPTPGIYRKGVSTAAAQYQGPRLPGVTKKEAASDHCPVYVDIPLAAL